MTLQGAFEKVGNKASWPVVQFRQVLRQRKETGRADLPTLGVSLVRGVVPRESNDGRPAASLDQSNYKVVYPGDIVMNALGKPHGSIGRSDFHGITSPAYWVLELNQSVAHPRYFHYLLRSDHAINEYQRLGKYLPPNQFDLPWDQFRNIEFPLPPVEEQRRIADFLDDQVGRIDSLGNLRRMNIDLLNELKQSTITAQVTSVDSALLVPLRYVSDIRSSNVDKKSVEGEIPIRLVNYTDVYYQSKITSQLSFMVATASREQVEKFRVIEGDSIITKDSESPDDIAVPTYVDEAVSDMVCGYHLAIVRPREALVPRYLYWSLSSAYMKEQFSSRANGMTRFGLSLEGIRGTVIPFPQVEEQRRIADFLDNFVETVELQTELENKGIKLLEERKRSLITAAVTGQMDVTTAKTIGMGKWVPNIDATIGTNVNTAAAAAASIGGI